MPRAGAAGAPRRAGGSGLPTRDHERRSPGAAALCPRREGQEAVPAAAGSAPSLLRAPPAAQNAGVPGPGESAGHPAGGLHRGNGGAASRGERCGARQRGCAAALANRRGSWRSECFGEQRRETGRISGAGGHGGQRSWGSAALGRVCGWCLARSFYSSQRFAVVSVNKKSAARLGSTVCFTELAPGYVKSLLEGLCVCSVDTHVSWERLSKNRLVGVFFFPPLVLYVESLAY